MRRALDVIDISFLVLATALHAIAAKDDTDRCLNGLLAVVGLPTSHPNVGAGDARLKGRLDPEPKLMDCVLMGKVIGQTIA